MPKKNCLILENIILGEQQFSVESEWKNYKSFSKNVQNWSLLYDKKLNLILSNKSGVMKMKVFFTVT